MSPPPAPQEVALFVLLGLAIPVEAIGRSVCVYPGWQEFEWAPDSSSGGLLDDALPPDTSSFGRVSAFIQPVAISHGPVRVPHLVEEFAPVSSDSDILL